MARNAKLDRLLTLVKALGESAEGLTLDEIAERLSAPTAVPPSGCAISSSSISISRKASMIAMSASASPARCRRLSPSQCRRNRCASSLADMARRAGSAQATLLESLLGEVQAGFRREVKSRMAPDLDPLVRLQHHHAPAGPMIEHAPETSPKYRAR